MRKYGKFLLISLIVFFAITSLSIICGAVILYKYSECRVDEDLISLVNKSGQTEFYRRGGTDGGECILIEDAKLNPSVKYEYVSYSDIPEDLLNAFIAIEDKRFADHNGVDILRSSKAVFNYLIHGQKSFGGSTITQQLVKNLTGNDQHLIKRKLTEAFCAINLEKEYDKSEIIEMYLNIINLSNGCRGIGAAARFYFSKDIDKLDLCESAAIAAITNNPAKYDPIRHPEDNQRRRNAVLSCMLEQGYIGEDEFSDAINKELILNTEIINPSHVNSWYIDAVISDVISDFSSRYGISKNTASILLYKGGYRIYTLMDNDIQSTLDSYFSDVSNFPEDSEGNTPQASMIVIDPYTGDVLGIAGAVGEKKGNRLLNFATDSKRPSGSAIKPLSVYAPAIDSGIVNWSSIFPDSPIREGNSGSSPWPSNANGRYSGDVTVEYALKNSLNTVAVRILHEVGNRYAFDFLKDKLKMNSLSEKKDIGDASLALGQHSVGVTLRELVSAYSIFEEGIMSKSRTYSKVTDESGRVILDNENKHTSVISSDSAFIMTKLMQGVIEEGTAAGLITLNDHCEVAGKTGTTQNCCDRYFVGYTPTLLAGVWQGHEMPRPLDYIGANYSAVIWDEVMSQIYLKSKYSSKKEFDKPYGVQSLSYDTKTGLPPSDYSYSEILQGWYSVGNKEQ